jgi:hypothetical protein
MSYYTAEYLRVLLEDLPDHETVFGILCLRSEQDYGTLVLENGVSRYESHIPAPEEWSKIVDRAESNAEMGGWDAIRECLNDAMHDVLDLEEED